MSSPPVLLIGFNRPDLAARTMEAVRQARPAQLFVAVDGPREGRDGESSLCSETRAVFSAVDWPCDLHTLFRDHNLGCRIGVRSAISWFFEHVEAGIILEDDCLPSSDLFPFCAQMLDEYRDDSRVMAICGSCYVGGLEPDRVYASYYADMWGWATWRRAWARYDAEMAGWPAFRAAGGLTAICSGATAMASSLKAHFDETHAGKIDTWDFQWIFSVMQEGGVALYPGRNMVSNTGFRPDGTHTLWVDHMPQAKDMPHGRPELPIRSAQLFRSSGFDGELERRRHGVVPTSARPSPDAITGVGVPEGPFPDLGIASAFRWVVSDRCDIVIARDSDFSFVEFAFANVIPGQIVTVTAGTNVFSTADAEVMSGWNFVSVLKISKEFVRNSGSLTIRFTDSTGAGDRRLYAAVYDVRYAVSNSDAMSFGFAKEHVIIEI